MAPRSVARTLLALFTIAAPLRAAATIHRVDPDATGAQDGTSWDDAFVDLQTALGSAVSGDELWLVAGTYKPSASTRTISFVVPANVTLFGGFAGDELSAAERDPQTNVTILSGEIGSSAEFDNSIHVVTLNQDCVLDGVTVTGGYSPESSPYPNLWGRGAGIVVIGANAVVRDAHVVGNHNPNAGPPAILGGAGLYAYQADGLLIEDCIFEDNHATGDATHGGAIWIDANGCQILRCQFLGNSAGLDGGAVEGADRIEDCHFENNSAGRSGGAVEDTNWIEDCHFENNSAGGPTYAGSGGAINGTGTVVRSYFVNNQGGVGGACAYVNLVDDCDFIANSATFVGGAVAGAPDIYRSRFFDNSAGADGGVVSYTGSGGQPDRIESSLFVGNEAGGSGGVLNAGHVLIVNCTMLANSAAVSHGAINENVALEARNSIIWGNAAPDRPNVPKLPGNASVYGNSIIQGSGGSAGWNPEFGVDAGANQSFDPGIVDPGGGDLRTGHWSAGHDAGDDSYVTVSEDIDGAPRIAGAAVDIGASEVECSTSGPIVYVDAQATGADDGTSWADAYSSVRAGILLPCVGLQEVWVAAGSYSPSQNRDVSINLRSGLALYGGFDGSESSRSERNMAANPTVLSGAVGSSAMTDNSRHVIVASGCDDTAVLDGFVISDGYLEAGGVDGRGAGVWIDGGSPVLRNLVLRDNVATTGGAIGMINRAAPSIVNVVAYDNEATYSGSFLYATSSEPTLANVTVANNFTPRATMVAYEGIGPMLLLNSVVFDNVANAAISFFNGDPPHLAHSIVEDSETGAGAWNEDYGTDGGNNLDVDPLFVDAAGQNFHLNAWSAGIDSGDPNVNSSTSDADGNPRVVGTIDRGAYEHDGITAAPEVLTATPLEGHPNPFNPTITLSFRVKSTTHARLIVYDVAGRQVRVLHDGPVNDLVRVRWDGTDDAGRQVASGVYLAWLTAGERHESVKMALLK